AVSVRAVASDFGLGLRQFERTFQASTGMSPKRYSRMARLQAALDAKISLPLRSWLDIAYSLGYHDQMHMVHDFHSLGGGTPGQVLSEMADMRPFTPDQD